MSDFIGEIVVFGESEVGKTCFVDMLIKSRHFSEYYGTIDTDSRYKMEDGGKVLETDIMDLSSTTLRTADATFSPDFFTQCLSRASGIVLLYDITSKESFEHITNQSYMYACMCRQHMGDDAGGTFEGILVGNKVDKVHKEPETRQVDAEYAEEWAESQGFKHFELTTNDKTQVDEAVHSLMRAVKRANQLAERDLQQDQKDAKQKAKTQQTGDKVMFKDKIKQAFGRSKERG